MSEYSSSVTKYGEGKYRVDYSYRSPDGKKHRTCKRGFNLQKDAKTWQKHELPKLIIQLEHEETLDENLTMDELIKEYMDYIVLRRRETTSDTKRNIIKTKIAPFFKDKKVFDIQAKTISSWQNYLLKLRKSNGKPYAPTYLRTISNQLSAILNHAVTFHNLPSNPVLKVERIGKKKAPECKIWTLDEYKKFSKAIQDKPSFFYAFEVFFWCGLREGELLALTANDIDCDKRTIRVKNSYYRKNGTDNIGNTKTDSSVRTVAIPENLADELREYIDSIYGLKKDMRIFPLSKSSLHKTMDKGSKLSGVKRITIHALRHSHISLLMNNVSCASVKDIANRAGHSASEITVDVYGHSYAEKDVMIAEQLNLMMGGTSDVGKE